MIILIFDSLRVITWLLPLITPGCVGIVDVLQISILKYIGLSHIAFITLVLMVTSVKLISNLPPMCYAALSSYGKDVYKLIHMVKELKARIKI